MKKSKQPTANRRLSRHRMRMYFVQFGLWLALGAVVYRIFFVQSTFGPGLLASAAKVQNTSTVELAQRGAILDTAGNTLAYDVPAYLLDIKTDSFNDLPALADALAPILGSTPSAVLAKLKSGSHWIRWPNPILATAKDKVNTALETLGKADKQDYSQAVTFTPTEQRFYPYGSFAANTIGFVGHDGVGVNGLEAQYNQQLSGTNGEISYTHDLWGMPIQSTVQTITTPVPGDNLETTIDQTIQGFVEQKMDQLVKQYKPEHAAIIVMDPNTGGILGMSSRPTFDPNKYWNAPSSTALNTNWAVNSSFEPGSTFKVLTLTAALSTHAISLDQTFQSGHTTVAGRTIYDWKRSGWGTLTFRQALEDSSNVGFAKIALKLGWPNLLHYMQVFGYLSPTGIDLPSEAQSIIFPQGSRHTVELATSGFGQGISVTPMQQMQAIGAIANGGKLIQPHLAKALIDPKTGKPVKTFAPVIKNPQVAPPNVIKQVNQTLVLDVSQGIDAIGQIPGYQVAGKTGTANTVNPKTGKYYTDRFIVSFIGYAPASHPKYEVYVTLDYPKAPIGDTWGSTIATPTARDLLQECLQYGHVAPDDPASLAKADTQTARTSLAVSQGTVPGGKSQTSPAKNAGKIKLVTVPSTTGLSLTAAKNSIQQLGLIPEVVGHGQTVEDAFPHIGARVMSGSKVYIVAKDLTGGKFAMPDLSGASARVALGVLSELGVSAEVNGAGYVTKQSTPAGTMVAPGSSITLTCQVPATATSAAALGAKTGTTGKGTGGTGGTTGNGTAASSGSG